MTLVLSIIKIVGTTNNNLYISYKIVSTTTFFRIARNTFTPILISNKGEPNQQTQSVVIMQMQSKHGRKSKCPLCSSSMRIY